MHGVKRVIIFCTMIVIIPAALIIIPLYLRKTAFADVTIPVAESDIIEIREGISSIFCERHTLHMNSNFNAFQLSSKPEISTNRKHIRLKKSMTLPDDTLEYWGFYLLKGAKVHLKFCSRYEGSRILVVRGQRALNTCGLLEHNNKKLGATFAQGHDQVKVFFEDITEIAGNIPSDELEKKLNEQNAVKNNTDALMERENHGGEDLGDDDDDDDPRKSDEKIAVPISQALTQTVRTHKKLKKGSQHLQQKTQDNVSKYDHTKLNITESRHHNHNKNTIKSIKNDNNNHTNVHNHQYRQEIYDSLYKHREKREQVYDRKYSHGGNAVNFTETDESNSISSFENGLFDCFNGNILLAEGFPPSPECHNAHFLENGSHRILSKHDITEDGYYYYIFYSDNDLVRNDIHAIFDIYKPTFQYSNLSNSQGCVNSTNCTFPINFLSDEIVIVEVPTRDGIEHEDDDITYLISTCHPRTEIYAIFPILVLIFILSCSFL